MKNLIYRFILIIVIFSSILGIYKQLSLLLNAQKEISRLEIQISNFTQKNSGLEKLLHR
jgi:cell division protein FtsL